MKNLLKNYRTELSQTVLDFLWESWSQVGVMGGTSPAEERLVDPEPLLLLTLECARQDSRIFDEVLDWLVQNAKWINVTRLTTLLEEDQICSPSILGAVAGFMAKQDNPLKWKTIAQKYQPKAKSDLKPLFQRNGIDLSITSSSRDETFARYGWQRSRIELRGQGQPIPFENSASFIFKSRAFFGVNMRADFFAYLALNGPITASRLARELGYSQRRAMETLNEMQMANVFQIHHDGNRKEYSIDASKGWESLFEMNSTPLNWFQWRSFARGVSKVWKKAFMLKEDGLTPYILETEMSRTHEEAREDLSTARIALPSKLTERSLLEAIR